MKLGIDFNQFNHFVLKRFLSRLGFKEVIDQFSIIEPGDLVHRNWWRIAVLKLVGKMKILRWLALIFSDGTLFMCIK